MPNEVESPVVYTGLNCNEVELLLEFRRLDKNAQDLMVDHVRALGEARVSVRAGAPSAELLSRLH